LVSGLLFALLLRHLGSWSITRQEVAWAVLLTNCLIGLLVLSGAVTGSQSAHADRSAAVIAAIATSVAVLLCLVVAQRQVPPAGRGALIGAAVGAIYATTAALIKSATGLPGVMRAVSASLSRSGLFTNEYRGRRVHDNRALSCISWWCVPPPLLTKLRQPGT